MSELNKTIIMQTGKAINSPIVKIEEKTQPFDKPIPAQLLNIEHKSRCNLFPWRGQFSPQLVESLLKNYAFPDSIVLDPFMGSGTVLSECARLGHEAYGYEINPAAFFFGHVYELCNMNISARRDLLTKTENILLKLFPEEFEIPLFRKHRCDSLEGNDFPEVIRKVADSNQRALLEALLVLADDATDKNKAYLTKWKLIWDIVLNLPYSSKSIHACLGDARKIDLTDHSIDFVLSSPPYINVFNYHHNFRTAIESLNWLPLVISRSEIGSNRKFRQNRFLTVVQYCIDMSLTLAELQRVCKNTARIVLVLGRESNVHKTPFFNGKILQRIAREVNNFNLVFEQSRAFTNRFGQKIYEDILGFTPESGDCRPRNFIIERSKEIGREILVESQERVPADRKHYIAEAIGRIHEVQPSPIWDPIDVRTERIGD